MALSGWYFTHAGSALVTSPDATKTSVPAQMATLSPATVSDSGDYTNASTGVTHGEAKNAAPPAGATGATRSPSTNSNAPEKAPAARKVKLDTKPSTAPVPKKQAVVKSKPEPRQTAPEKSVKQREIEFLSERARLRLQQGKLDSPFGDNAVYYRDELVRAAPGSAVAARISYDIAESYRNRAEKEISSGQFMAARASIDEGLRMRPDHKRLKRLKENAVSEYSKGWAKGMYDQFKQSFSNAEAGPVRGNSPGPDR
jgi:hypothetical protein